MQADARSDAQLVRGVLESLDDELLVLAVPGTDYKLHLIPGVRAAEIRTPIGKRIKGVIHARALRMHKASAGGQFIEPIYGHPRIVQGEVLAVDPAARRVLVDVAIPMWVETAAGQNIAAINPGDLVNFYVQSGATFTPQD